MKEFLENHSGLQNGLALVYRFLGGTRKKIRIHLSANNLIPEAEIRCVYRAAF